MVVGKNRKFSHKEIPKKMAEMVPKEGRRSSINWCLDTLEVCADNFRRTCILDGKVAKLIIDPRSGMNIVSEEVVRKLGLETKRHLTPYQLEWLTKRNEVRVSKYLPSAFFYWR
jgi:hypothetical protein